MKIFCTAVLFLAVQLAQAQFTRLYDFTSENDLKYPKGDLVSDGIWLYGMTTGGGTYSLGTIFKIKPDGTGLTKLWDFNGSNGSNPYGTLTISGSVLFGMTRDGGTNNLGTVFKIYTDGTGFTKVIDFDGTNNGAYPLGSVTPSGSVLYGMSYSGGAFDYGTIFKINTDGSGYVKLLDFDSFNLGSNPTRGLVVSGSTLFGMTAGGGIYGGGVFFRMNTDGTGFSKLIDFDGTIGSTPWSSPVLSGSTLYGMTMYGGINNQGVIFKINTDGSGFSKLIDFDNTISGAYPYHSLTISGSVLYGMTYMGGYYNKGLVFKLNTNGTGYTVLLDFNGINGSGPIGSLTLSGSSLYGTTSVGGTSDKGSLFRINTDGTGYFKLLNVKSSPTGINPKHSKLVSDGTWLYGTALNGGTGYGVVYKVRTDGTGYTKLFDCDGSIYGEDPAGLILSGSTLFGVTNSGGTNNLGIIFKINTDGSGYTKLCDFDGTNYGSFPNGLILSGSTLYGCTKYGGLSGFGVVYKISTTGTGYTKLLDFDGSNNGRHPNCAPILSGTTLYGTTVNGGLNDRGTIFKINTDGTGYIKLLDFDGTNGSVPYGSLTLVGSTLYGMASGGGSYNFGVIFKIQTDGTGFTDIVGFDGTINGANPYGGLTSSGSALYGMTYSGGTNDKGVFFQLDINSNVFLKLFDFNGPDNGKFSYGTLTELNCVLYGTTFEGGLYDGGVVFKYDPKPTAAGVLTGLTTICEGQTGITYSVPTLYNAISYVWTLPSGATGISTSNSITVNYGTGSLSGNITVKGINSCGNGTLTTYPVTINHIPAAAGTISGSPVVNRGQNSVTYSVAAISDATSYMWSYTGTGATINSNGSSSITINFSNAATPGSLTVYGSSSCGNGVISSGYSITVTTQAPSIGTVTQPTCILQTGSAVLSDLPASGTWTVTTSPGGITTGGTGTTTTISGLAPGTYTFTVTNSSGYTSIPSANVIINTPKKGFVPKIKAKWADVLICYNLDDSVGTYKWYKGSTPIGGAGNQYYVTNQVPGVYSVETTDVAGCKNFSNSISITGTVAISVYPNPASEGITLKIADYYESNVVVSILNSSGIKLMEFQAEITYDGLLKDIPVSQLGEGIYFIKVLLDHKELYSTKFVVLR